MALLKTATIILHSVKLIMIMSNTKHMINGVLINTKKLILIQPIPAGFQ